MATPVPDIVSVDSVEEPVAVGGGTNAATPCAADECAMYSAPVPINLNMRMDEFVDEVRLINEGELPDDEDVYFGPEVVPK